MIGWLAAAAVMLLFLLLLPRMLRRAKAATRKSGGSGIIVAIGIAFSMIFDAKASHSIELIDRKKDNGDSEDGESGEKP